MYVTPSSPNLCHHNTLYKHAGCVQTCAYHLTIPHAYTCVSHLNIPLYPSPSVCPLLTRPYHWRGVIGISLPLTCCDSLVLIPDVVWLVDWLYDFTPDVVWLVDWLHGLTPYVVWLVDWLNDLTPYVVWLVDWLNDLTTDVAWLVDWLYILLRHFDESHSALPIIALIGLLSNQYLTSPMWFYLVWHLNVRDKLVRIHHSSDGICCILLFRLS